MPAERRRPARHDGSHHATLHAAETTGMHVAKSFAGRGNTSATSKARPMAPIRIRELLDRDYGKPRRFLVAEKGTNFEQHDSEELRISVAMGTFRPFAPGT
jgi:hypothetical protein